MKNTESEVKTIILDSGIYKAPVVRKAIRDYDRFARFNMRQEQDRILVEIDEIDAGVKDTIEYEFCNYVLWKLRN